MCIYNDFIINLSFYWSIFHLPFYFFLLYLWPTILIQMYTLNHEIKKGWTTLIEALKLCKYVFFLKYFPLNT